MPRGRIVKTARIRARFGRVPRGSGETFARRRQPSARVSPFLFPRGAIVDNVWLWVGFNIFVVAMLAIDLFVFHKEAHEVRVREAAGWSVAWVALAMLFGAGVYTWMGREAGLEFFAGYVIEKALSVDNIFVFVLIFGLFKVPPRYQHR